MISLRTEKMLVLSVVLSVLVGTHHGWLRANTVRAYPPGRMDCGPRCLWAIAQISGGTTAKHDIPHIYQLIGKHPYAPTNLAELRHAAMDLGFQAKAYRLGIHDLKDMKDYAIVPVGHTAGTEDKPLHFQLIVGVTREHALIVDCRTLKKYSIPIAEFSRDWNGMALIISVRGAERSVRQPDSDAKGPAKQTEETEDGRTIDLGEHEVGATIKHSMVISDASDASTGYRIAKRSCACIDASLDTDGKGETLLTVTMRVSTPGPQGAIVAVVADSGEDTPRLYRFRAYGNDATRTIPRYGYIKAEGGETTYTVKVRYFTTVADTVAVFEGLVTDIESLQCGQVVSTQRREEKMIIFDFEIPLVYSLTANQPRRTFSREVIFVLRTSNGKREIPFHLTIEPGGSRFGLVPGALFMRYSKSNPDVGEKAVRLQRLPGVEIERISLQQDDVLPVQTSVDSRTDGEVVVHVAARREVLRDISPGVHKGDIRVALQGPTMSETVTLPVVFVVYE